MATIVGDVTPPLIKDSLSCREDQRLSTEGKIVSEYSNIPKPLGRFQLLPPPPPPPPSLSTLDK